MIKFLDLQDQYRRIQGDVDAALNAVIRDATFIGGPSTSAFEKSFAGYQQAAHCIGVGNGTDAIEIGIEALSLPPGSEIIVPANSFIASSEAVTRAGHKVVFADVDEDSYLLDLEDVDRRITPRTSAIVAVHLYGNPCDMDALLGVARRHGLKVVEDCAQAHGAEWLGRRVGSIGDFGAFSFYPGKNLGAYGDAGAILTNDESLARRCRMIANHGRIDKYNHEFEGRNSRLDGVQAAVLNAKLKYLDGWIDQRGQSAVRYLAGLAGIDSLKLPQVRKGSRHAYHLFVVRCKRRDELAAFLAAREIQTGIHYPIALPKLRAYAYTGQAAEPLRANMLDGEVLSLPMGDHLHDEDVDAVIAAVREFFGRGV